MYKTKFQIILVFLLFLIILSSNLAFAKQKTVIKQTEPVLETEEIHVYLNKTEASSKWLSSDMIQEDTLFYEYQMEIKNKSDKAQSIKFLVPNQLSKAIARNIIEKSYIKAEQKRKSSFTPAIGLMGVPVPLIGLNISKRGVGVMTPPDVFGIGTSSSRNVFLKRIEGSISDDIQNIELEAGETKELSFFMKEGEPIIAIQVSSQINQIKLQQDKSTLGSDGDNVSEEKARETSEESEEEIMGSEEIVENVQTTEIVNDPEAKFYGINLSDELSREIFTDPDIYNFAFENKQINREKLAGIYISEVFIKPSKITVTQTNPKRKRGFLSLNGEHSAYVFNNAQLQNIRLVKNIKNSPKDFVIYKLDINQEKQQREINKKEKISYQDKENIIKIKKGYKFQPGEYMIYLSKEKIAYDFAVKN